MGILINKNTKVVVQGITGREGSVRTKYMKSYGTHVVGGTSPGKKGSDVHGVPVYNTVKEIAREHGEIDFSVIFVPGHVLKTAVMEAADAGVKNVIPCVEGTPIHDIMEMIAYCKAKGTRLLGPGSIGIITPGEAVVGWLGGNVEWANTFGVSTVIHTGTEPVLGTSMADLLPLFEEDPETEGVAVYAEIGGSQEEECAEVIASGKFTKPFVVYVSGAWAPEGQRFSHASNIVERGRGSAKSKMDAITKAGGYVAMTPTDIPVILHEKLKK